MACKLAAQLGYLKARFDGKCKPKQTFTRKGDQDCQASPATGNNTEAPYGLDSVQSKEKVSFMCICEKVSQFMLLKEDYK